MTPTTDTNALGHCQPERTLRADRPRQRQGWTSWPGFARKGSAERGITRTWSPGANLGAPGRTTSHAWRTDADRRASIMPARERFRTILDAGQVSTNQMLALSSPGRGRRRRATHGPQATNSRGYQRPLTGARRRYAVWNVAPGRPVSVPPTFQAGTTWHLPGRMTQAKTSRRERC